MNNRAVVVGDGRNGTTEVPTYDWGSMLSNFFVKFDSILSTHYFNIGNGKITAKQYIEDPRARVVSILKPSAAELTPTELPDVIVPPGLNVTRQWYLFEQIREFCKENCRDLVCPKPKTAKPTGRTSFVSCNTYCELLTTVIVVNSQVENPLVSTPL